MNNKIYKEIASDLGLNESDIKDVFKYTWEFIRKKIEELPLKEDLTEEEFNNLKTTFMLPEIGKLGCDYNTYRSIRKSYLLKQKSNVENDECETSGKQSNHNNG
jgi:hypothetical protein